MPRVSEDRIDEARKLRGLRTMLGLSQRDMARHFNVAPGAVALWEGGRRTIPGPVLRLMEIYEDNLGMVDKPRTIRKINSSWVGRTLKTSGMAAKFTAKLASSSLQQLVAGNERATQIKAATQEAIAYQMAESLGEMKGLLMKVGQILSYMDFALPENARALLSALQDSTKPMDPDVVRRIIEQDFGVPPEELFAKWSKYPVAAASIGQVHKAALKDGTEVAVKVQYPEIARTIESDLANTAIFDRLGSILMRGQERGAIVQEIRERLLEECDYEKEAGNVREFGRIHAGDPAIVIPRVFDEYSSKRVLTTQFMHGKRFAEFASTASQEERNAAGETILRMAFQSIFTHHIFNCDPHPGNYLFQDGKVVFLDFGCVRRYGREFMSQWKSYVRSVLEGDRALSDRLVIKMGFAARPEAFDFDYHHRMILVLYEPWMKQGRFKCTRHFVESVWRAMVADNPNKFVTNLPREWVFTNRLQWGLFSVLAELEAEFNSYDLIRKLLYADKNS